MPEPSFPSLPDLQRVAKLLAGRGFTARVTEFGMHTLEVEAAAGITWVFGSSTGTDCWAADAITRELRFRMEGVPRS